MPVPQDFRELAQRAELEFHVRPHPFRRRAWQSGLVLALICGVWIVYAAAVGNHRVYEAGPLSDSHAFIANDCRQCHTTWQPARRLVLGESGTSSIDNAACARCHAADEHHPQQIPAHAQMSCAECHREHQGKPSLAQVTDAHCTRCHQDLQTTNGPSTQFARNNRGFGEAEGHPEFNLLQRLKEPQTPANLISPAELDAILKRNPARGAGQRKFLDVLTEREPPPIQADIPLLRDRGAIQFNHAAHLTPLRMKNKFGEQVDLSQNCGACHVPDAAGQYMLPIRYEQHCAECHPLWFDNRNYAGEVVPHEGPDVVRGFLTERYTLAVLNRKTTLTEPAARRPLPGAADRPALSVELARQLEELVSGAERAALEHERAVTGRGGCKLCHTVNRQSETRNWSIEPTRIPERWMPHSQFDHQAHRLLQCSACHAAVEKKRDTSDVMLPGIAECRECHVSPSASVSYQRTVTGHAQSTRVIAHDVRSSCVLCHLYHQRDSNERSGSLDSGLRRSDTAAKSNQP